MDKFNPKNQPMSHSLFQPPGFDLRSVPFRFHADEIDSQYVRFSVHLNVTDQDEFPAEEWFFVELLAYVWQKSPLDVNGEAVELADVIKRKDKVRDFGRESFLSLFMGKGIKVRFGYVVTALLGRNMFYLRM